MKAKRLFNKTQWYLKISFILLIDELLQEEMDSL